MCICNQLGCFGRMARRRTGHHGTGSAQAPNHMSDKVIRCQRYNATLDILFKSYQ